MRKISIAFAIFFIVIAISFSSYCQGTKKVLLAAELVGFEIGESKINAENKNIINTSLKTLGVVTCIKPETGEFVALGHSLTKNIIGANIDATCYAVQLKHTNKLDFSKAYFIKENPIGTAFYDSYCGIYGKMNEITNSKYQEVQTGNRFDIKKGKANILIRLKGEKLESFEVEIVSIDYMENNQNIRIKITDENLIRKTGGIVQGMSGTPVMQDGKLIGAINAVNAQDSKDAYAIFIDKII